ncbi:MAG: hypothetical protein ACPG4W_05690 [Flavobacteriales bacterium]
MKAQHLLLTFGLILGINQTALAGHGPRYYDHQSNKQIDRIQVNKMRMLKQEFKAELRFNHFRKAKFIKFEIIELIEKDIRFQRKKIREVKRKIEALDNPYFRRGNRNGRQGGQQAKLRRLKHKLFAMKDQMREKKALFNQIEGCHSHRGLRAELRLFNQFLQNMRGDLDLYNQGGNHQYYRRGGR